MMRYILFTIMRYRKTIVTGILFYMLVHVLFNIYLKYKVLNPVPLPKALKNGTYLIDTEGYKLPDFDPFDETIIQYIEPTPTLNCNKGKRLLTTGISNYQAPNSNSKRTSAILLHDLYKSDYGAGVLSCCFQAIRRDVSEDGLFERFGDKDSFPDNIYYVEKECHLLLNEITPVSESAVLVRCFSNSLLIYRNVHFFIQFDYQNKINTNNERNYNFDSLNVLIFGLDSVSRLNEHRYMPKTLKMLKKLDAIDLKGYNKIYENTYPNLLALLTGHQMETNVEIIKKDNGFHDHVPFIWTNYSKNGYKTVYGEDCTNMGSFVYNSRKGFKNSPTNYYLQPFFKAIEEQLTEKNVFDWLKHGCETCSGMHLNLNYMLSYAEVMSQLFYKTNKYFSVLWSTALTHDKLEFTGIADEPISNFLLNVYNDENWNNTIIFLISDHGMRFGNIRKTYIGMKEENMPMGNIILPKWFKLAYPTAYDNLAYNQNRLTTHFDIFETLKDILNKNYENEQYLKEDHVISNIDYKFTLFRKIPGQRTCSEANIPIQYCSGLTATETSITPEIMLAAEFLMKSINKGLELFPECYQLLGYKIYKSYKIHYYEEEFDKEYDLYQIQIISYPGDAILEGLLKVPVGNTNFEPIIMGTVNRLNLYRGQSECIDDATFKKYCLCKSLYP